MKERINFLSVIGNGDPERGLKLLRALSNRLLQARRKHIWQCNGEISNGNEASKAIFDEAVEYCFAVSHETQERQTDEILDVLAVAVRCFNREFEDDEKNGQISG